MKLKVIAEPHLRLIDENEIKEYEEVFEVSQERGIEILKTVFNGKPVVELIPQEDSDLENLKAANESLTKENEDLKAANESLTKENEDLKVKVLELQEDNRELNQKITDLTKDNKKNNKKDEGKGEE